jgi:hypothetical protein
MNPLVRDAVIAFLAKANVPVADIYSETEECYPGLAIRDLGYACLAIDPTGSGDPYFMRVADGDNPPVFQVYHDVSDVGTVIEQEGMIKIADSLSELFTNALP